MVFNCRTILIILFLYFKNVISSAKDNNNASKVISSCNQSDCLRCDLDTGECLKCLYVLMVDTRACLESCPVGYFTSWAETGAYKGRICTERSLLSRITGRDIMIIAAAAAGGAVCVGVVLGALLYMRRRTKPNLPTSPPPGSRGYPKVPWIARDKRPSAAEVSVEGAERQEFLTQLSSLRGESNNFLQMLNETRNKFRSLGAHDSATDTKSKAYRAVVRDLSRVLSLLNRRDDHIRTVPADWRRLLSWASRVLARYKRMKYAKETGEINYLDALPGTGTLYQTRQQQLKAERQRLAANRLTAMCTDMEASETTNNTSIPVPYNNDNRSTVLSLTTMSLEDEPLQKPNFQIGEKTSILQLSSLPPVSHLQIPSEDSLTNKELAEVNHRSQKYFGARKITDMNFRSRANSLTSAYDECKRFRNSLTTTSSFANKYSQLWKQNNKVNSLSLFASKCEDLLPNSGKQGFWNKFTLSKSCTNLTEVDLEEKNNTINESKNNDYIPSPTLFDHIETFSFDDVLTESSSKSSSPASSVKKMSYRSRNSHSKSETSLTAKSKQQTKADLERFSNLLDQKLSNHLESKKKYKTEIIINDDLPQTKLQIPKPKKSLHDKRLENNMVNRSMVGGDMYISVTRNRVITRPKINIRNKLYKKDSYTFKDSIDSYRDDNSLNSSGNESISSWNDSIESSSDDMIISRNDSFGSSTKDSLQTTEPSTPDLMEDSMNYPHSIQSIARCDFTITV